MRTPELSLLLCALAACAGLPACTDCGAAATSMRPAEPELAGALDCGVRRAPPEAWRLGGLDGPGCSRGATWALVIAPDESATLAGGEAQPEFFRNDAAVNVRPDGPLLATTQWPEAERRSLSYPRAIYLHPRADTHLFFEHESRYRGYGGDRGEPVAPAHGRWGFWR